MAASTALKRVLERLLTVIKLPIARRLAESDTRLAKAQTGAEASARRADRASELSSAIRERVYEQNHIAAALARELRQGK